MFPIQSNETDRPRMQEEALESIRLAEDFVEREITIEGIHDYWMAYGHHVFANLVHATSHDAYAQKRHPVTMEFFFRFVRG